MSHTISLEQLRKLKIAIVHDWLIDYGGAERVLAEIVSLFPEADLFALLDFYDDDKRATIGGKHARTSFIQKFPWARTQYRKYLPLMPLAVEQFDLSEYDLVISSNHAVAKGVITGPDQLHLSYVYSPLRYAWDLTHQYLRESGLDRGLRSWFVKYALHRLRIWDARTSAGVDEFIADSGFIARRIEKCYRRQAKVIYPPVNVEAFCIGGERNDFYLTASRMVPYKRIDLVVKAFAQIPARKLVVIGDGPEFVKIKRLATSNVTILGYQSEAVLIDYMQRARGFVFAAKEDFGIIPIEAMACGTPVIAFGEGGARETVVNNRTGLLFTPQTVSSLVEAIERFEAVADPFDSDVIRDHALQFGPERFRTQFVEAVAKAVAEYSGLDGSERIYRPVFGNKLSVSPRTKL